MDQTVTRRLDRVSAAWQAAWVRTWPDDDRRSDLVDVYAWTHAMASLVAATGDTSEMWIPSASELVRDVVEADLGRPALAPVAVAANAGWGRLHGAVVAERSRPGWHLRGTADVVLWPSGTAMLLVLAVDEGDNEVVTLVAADAPGVTVQRSGGVVAAVRMDDVGVDDDALVHAPDVRAALVDRLTVLRLVDELDAADPLVRAAVRAAARSAATATPLERQHDVSVAAVVVLPPGELLDWHRQRLVPLI